MNSKSKLLEKAKNNPRNLKFKEFITLIEQHGWEFKRVNGSHHLYLHPIKKIMLNIQNNNGFAKEYQVRQFLGNI